MRFIHLRIKSWAVSAAVISALLWAGMSGGLAGPGGSETFRAVSSLQPTGIAVAGPDTLSDDEKAAMADAAVALFDNDTSTSFKVARQGVVEVQLERETELHSFSLMNTGGFRLTVQAEVQGSWQVVDPFNDMAMASGKAGEWRSYSLALPVTTSRLRFELSPANDGDSAGIQEIELWGAQAHVAAYEPHAFLKRMEGDNPPPQGRLFTADHQQGSIGPVLAKGAKAASNQTFDDPSDNRFTLNIPYAPAAFRHAYLVYEMYGLPHWVSGTRSINGMPGLGGVPQSRDDVWSTQIEEINPAWLVQGKNSVVFSVPANKFVYYTVKNVRVLAELEDGHNFVASMTGSPQVDAATHPALDGDTDTGWQPGTSQSEHRDGHGAPYLQMNFERQVQLQGVSLYIANGFEGRVRVYFPDGKEWEEAKLADGEGESLRTGWNYISCPSGRAVQGMKLAFDGAERSAFEVREIVPVGSGIGPKYQPQRLHVLFPDQGQFFGRKAYIRGFLQMPADSKGLATITVAGQKVPHQAGEFGVWVSKDDVGLANQGDAEPWSVEVKATYPNGEKVSQVVKLTKHLDAVQWTDVASLPVKSRTVKPDEAAEIDSDGARLEIGKGALASEATISITSLQPQDMARLDPGLNNVTRGPRSGYRFLPHGSKFKQKIKVSIPIDPALIPAGKTVDDVRTYFFDEEAGRWVPLQKVTYDAANGELTSYTDHFTDMIAGTLTVPDHPTPMSFNPNSMKDIKAADPGAGINLIEAPQANNMGDARLSYPIEVPAGRAGMQPQLAVQYSSAGGNGWMGLGWDIAMQSISVDTRWGVPRYDGAKETETYMLNGEMLTPVAHRSDLVNRSTGDKVFHARVEGQFRKIVRHGTSPKNYWWEVTDKNGTRYFYGAQANASGPEKDATLDDGLDGKGHIFKWALREVRDSNGNTMLYKYVRVADVGVVNGSVAGSQLYLKEIDYTGRPGAVGKYAVKFIRDREQPNFQRRQDVSIDARGGFKMVTADRLKRIEVTFAGQLVRSYEFAYRTGAFDKTLLASVTQKGDNDQAFNTHTFEYFDDFTPSVKNGQVQFDNEHLSGIPSSGNLDLNMMVSNEQATAIGTTSGYSFGPHLYVGVGVGCSQDKSLSGGIKVGATSSQSNGVLTLMDVNGDGLPDQLFDSGAGFKYVPGKLSPDGRFEFANVALDATALPGISKDSSMTLTAGGEVYFYANALFDGSYTTSTSDRYMTDVNGDGIPDLADGGSVWFGSIDDQGSLRFTANSYDTPVPLGGIPAAPNTTLSGDLRDQLKEKNPLVDPIRRWVAPFDGDIAISGDFALIDRMVIDPEAAKNYTKADGVKIMIQHNTGNWDAGTQTMAGFWSSVVGADDFGRHAFTELAAEGGSYPALTRIPVKKGDRIYFRVHSRDDGKFDQVQWNPVISYLDVPSGLKDENGFDPYTYAEVADYTSNGLGRNVQLGMKGTVIIDGKLSKPSRTSDDLALRVFRIKAGQTTEELVAEKVVAWDATGEFGLNDSIQVEAGDSLRLQIRADTPVDVRSLDWKPKIVYTDAWALEKTIVYQRDANGNIVFEVIKDKNGNPVLDRNGNPAKQPVIVSQSQTLKQVPTTDANGKPIYTYQAVAGVDLYPLNSLTAPLTAWSGKAGTQYDVQPSIAFSGTKPVSSEVALAVKKSDGSLVAKQLYQVDVTEDKNNKKQKWKITLTPAGPVSFQAENGVSYFFVLASRDVKFSENGLVATAELHDPTVPPAKDPNGKQTNYWQTADAAFHLAEISPFFNSAFRGWSHFGYNANNGATENGSWVDWPAFVDESVFICNKTNGTCENAFGKVDDRTGEILKPVRVFPATLMETRPESHVQAQDTWYWNFADTDIWLTGSHISASRMGLKSLDFSVQVNSESGHSGFAPGISIPRLGQSTTMGLGVGFTYGGGSVSEGSSRGILDFMDLNGDRFPDVLNFSGGIVQYTSPRGYLYDAGGAGISRSDDQSSANIGINGSISRGVPGAGGAINAFLSDLPPIGLGGGMTVGDADAQADLIDVNGDGLPDLVSQSGNGLAVAINLGYRFAPAEIWGVAAIRSSHSESHTLNVGYNNGDYSWGGGASLSDNKMDVHHMLADINGDGLPDYLSASGNLIQVALNTGTGFGPAMTIAVPTGQQSNTLSRNASLSGSAGGYFSFTPFCLYGYKVVLNLGANAGLTMGRQEFGIRDMNGDGYPDLVTSTSHSSMDVAFSPIGRTNMLRKVTRPLGATIEIDYERSGNTYEQPQNRWVMKSVTVNDGHAGDGVDTQLTTYRYEDGYYDRLERDFFGYRMVTEEQRDTTNGVENAPVYRKTVTRYLNDSYYTKGLVERTLLQGGDDRKYTESLNEYALFDVDRQQTIDMKGRYLTETGFPQLIRTDKRFYEGQTEPGKRTYVTYAYDEYGNVSAYFDAGDSLPEDDVQARIDYVHDLSAYIVGKPTRIVVNSNGVEMRRREGSIQPGTGNLTQVREYLADGQAAVTDLDYYPNGNLRTVTGPANHRGQRYTIRYEYDPDVSTHIAAISDSFGYRSTAEYNYGNGTYSYDKPTLTRDINNNDTRYTYDNFGRTRTVTGPYQIGGIVGR